MFQVPVPDFNGRKEIFDLYLGKILCKNVDVDVLARGKIFKFARFKNFWVHLNCIRSINLMGVYHFLFTPLGRFFCLPHWFFPGEKTTDGPKF